MKASSEIIKHEVVYLLLTVLNSKKVSAICDPIPAKLPSGLQGE